MMTENQPIARLLWRTDNVNQELLIGQDDIVTIGRGDMNMIVIDSPRVSRNHARIEWDGEVFTVLDLRSSNGTFVNGQRLDYLPCRLENGDYIFLERFPIRFELIPKENREQDVSTMPTVPIGLRAQETAKPRLVITGGTGQGQEIIIDKNVLVIGRESQNATWDVQLKDQAISRPHARIEQVGGKYTIFDTGSANGTTVNNDLIISSIDLKDGDIIEVGATQLVFHIK